VLRVKGQGLRVWGFEVGVESLGRRVWGFWCRVRGLGFRVYKGFQRVGLKGFKGLVQGLGFMGCGLGFRVSNPRG